MRAISVKKIQALLSLVFLALTLNSCAHVTALRTQEIQAVGNEVKALHAQIDSLNARIAQLEENQARQQKRLSADMSMVMAKIGEDFEKVSARMEENQYRLDMLIGKSDKILSKKVVVEKRVTVNNTPGLGEGSTPPTSATEETQVKTLFDLDMEKIYNTAKEDFHKSQYKLAYDGFKQVYEKKSGTKLAENSLYWMGLCLLETKQKDKAITVLKRVVQEFPTGSKLCVTKFRMAQIYGSANKTAEQTGELKSLVETPQCTSTNEAMKAQEMLKGMSQ